MLGKKLYYILQELNTSERKLLFSKAKKSRDKRYTFLLQLMGYKKQSAEAFTANIEKLRIILGKQKNGADIELEIRRILDFCIKEIENLKINQLVNTDKKLRYYLLAEVYKNVSTKDILEDYLKKLVEAIDVEQDFWQHDFYLKSMSNLKLRTQSKSDIEDWKHLLAIQVNSVEKYYTQKRSVLLDKIASIYMDDRESVFGFDENITAEKKNLELAKRIADKQTKAIIYGALAQFNFENAKFTKYYNTAIELIKDENGTAADYIKRKLLLLNFLHAFHTGQAAKKIIPAITEVVNIDIKYKINDQRNIFFLFLSQIIYNDRSGPINYYTTDTSQYLNLKDSEYFYHFLQAFTLFTDKKYRQANKILIELQYGKNVYISTWARLLEIYINILLGRPEIAENLLANEIRLVSASKNKIFTLNSSAKLIIQLADKLLLKTPPTIKLIAGNTTYLSPFHNLLQKSVH